MADNNNNSSSPQWWSKVPIRDLAVLIGGVGFFYLNVVGAVETLKIALNEIKIEIKENNRVTQEVVIHQTKLSEKIYNIDERLKKIEENEKNNNR